MIPRRAVAATALVIASTPAPSLAASSSSDELVRQARAHEASREDDLALKRYAEALAVDATNADAWMGLGALRLRLGEAAEAERVYAAAMVRVPSLRGALSGRAHARWALGRHEEAEADLDAYATLEGDVGALRELSTWFGADQRVPEQLAIWRRLRAYAEGASDAASEREARRMVRALVILVGGADPASTPADASATRRALAAIARRGG